MSAAGVSGPLLPARLIPALVIMALSLNGEDWEDGLAKADCFAEAEKTCASGPQLSLSSLAARLIPSSVRASRSRVAENLIRTSQVSTLTASALGKEMG